MVGRVSPPEQPQPPAEAPDWNLDKNWSLQPWPVEFTFAGYDYVIPEYPASVWLSCLMDLNPSLIVPGLVAEPGYLVWDALDAREEYDRLLLDIIETVSARKWWITLRLIAIAKELWPTTGTATCLRANPSQVSLSLWLDVLTELLFERIKPEYAPMFVVKTEMPPPGHESEEEPEAITAEEFLSGGWE